MKNKLLFWIPNILLVGAMVASAIAYFSDIPGTIEAFNMLGYPGYVLYFNGTAKILGGIAILFPVARTLKEFAYAGYLYIILLAGQALYINMPAMAPTILIFIIVWILAYWGYRRVARI
ncbi:MAG: DoxX family protein [Candidatus Peregrinibacteria bacterium]|nr:DoxX family protein [Candidatus Peregrinibacteria bacterium]MCB9808599.1 DoxX family protein [Candidatus Peribacteria bacterium]